MKNSQSKSTLRYFDLLIKILLFSLLSSFSLANENKIGSVTEVNGTIIAITDELNERDLSIHDPIFINEEIFVTEGSSATIQFEDNTAIIMKELTSLNVSEFENSKLNPKIKAELLKGKIIIESGSIAKNSNGKMLIDVLTTSLGLRGTRVDININTDGKSAISLAEDSFGNVGKLEVSSEGQTSTISSPEQVLEVSENNEVNSREKTNEEKEEEKNVTGTLIKSSKIDEIEIEQQLQKKLEEGKLQDANNDGIIDESDIKATKDQITQEKKQNIDFIVENSKDENTDFLSDVINQSDDKNTGEVIEKIIDIQDNLVEGVVENLSDKNNKFLTTSISEGADLIKEKIFETIVSKETNKSAEVLSKVMAKADTVTINSVINNITEKNTNVESKLSLKVMADFSEKNPDKLETLSETNSDQISKLTVSAVEKASNSNEDAELIAKVVVVASNKLANKVVEEVSKNSTDENQILSAKVLKAIIDTNPNKLEAINNDIKDTMISQTIQSAQNQQEGIGIQESEDMTSIISDIIVNTDTETASQFITKVNNIQTETNLSLEIISGISQKDSTILNVLSENNKEQMDQLTIDAIQNAENTSEDSDLIAQVVSVVNDDLINVMIEEVSKVSIDKKQTLSAKVLQAIVETEPDKMEIINNETKDVMIQQTVESAKNQQEGSGILEDEDFTDIVSQIIVNTSSITATKIIKEINEIDTETNLSLDVISGISEKDSEKLDTLSKFNKTQVEELTIDAIQNAENTSEDSQLIANVVSVVSDQLINTMIEEVNKTSSSSEKKQSFSTKVLKAIVNTEPLKIDALDEDIKEKIIEQTIESAKDQQEGNLIETVDLADLVAEIIVKTDNKTAIKMIEEINDSETDSNLSLEVISGVSKKDENKLNDLSLSIKDEIEELAEDAVKKAENTLADSEKIVDIVAVANTDLLNFVIEEVTDVSINENQSLSAKVLKGIVDIEPDKMLDIEDNNKNDLIENTVETAKSQNEGDIVDDNETISSSLDYTKVITDIVNSSDNDTATKVLEEIDSIETETDFKLDFLDELDDKAVDILSAASSKNDDILSSLVNDAVEKINNENDKEKLTNILNDSDGTITDKIIEAGNNNEKNKETISQALVDVAETNIEKVAEVLQNNKSADEIVKVLKDKIENDDAVTISDFEEVFTQNISPN